MAPLGLVLPRLARPKSRGFPGVWCHLKAQPGPHPLPLRWLLAGSGCDGLSDCRPRLLAGCWPELTRGPQVFVGQHLLSDPCTRVSLTWTLASGKPAGMDSPLARRTLSS